MEKKSRNWYQQSLKGTKTQFAKLLGLIYRTSKIIIPAFALLVLASCADRSRQLRGFEEKSLDEKSYLVIEEGACDEYFLDDKPWPYAIGEKGEINLGDHCLSCGKNGKPVFAGTCFKVKERTIFHFDYWGP